MVYGLVDVAESAEARGVGGEHDFVFPGGGEDAVVVEASGGGEVEYEDELAAAEGEDLVVVFLPEFLDSEGLEVVGSADEFDHGVVEGVEEFVLEVFAVDEVPLAACVFVAPSVAFAGEVDPLGVAEFVAHEVEVAAIDGGEGYEAYHFVECHSAGYGGVGVADHHVPVHFLVDETEDYGLVAYECLVMAFDVGDCLFVGAAVGEFPEDGGGMPVLVFFLLEEFDPVVGDAHCHAVVESDAAVFDFDGEAGHAAHFLGDGDGVWVDFVDEFVGEGEVYDGVGVLVAVVVVGVGAEGFSEAVVVVEHGGYAVEAEAVEAVFLEPVFAVGEQEVEHFVFAVVEA